MAELDYITRIDSTGLVATTDPRVPVLATDYGVTADCVIALDGAITSATPTVSSASSSFSVDLIGLSVSVVGAGASGATLNTTIIGVPSGTSLTLAVNASTTVSSARVIYGTDNGPLLQDALDDCLASGRKIVFVPRGIYFFPTGDIDIPQSVTLQGAFDFRAVHRGGGCGLTDPEYSVLEGDGTTFMITADEGATSGWFMRLTTNSAVRGLSTYYPAQIPSLATPKVYPFTFELRGTSAHLENIEIGLAYKGIKSVQGDYQVVRNVIGQPLAVGLQATQLLNSPQYNHIDFVTVHDYLSDDPLDPGHGCDPGPVPLVEWQLANGVAFQFGRVDNGRAWDLLAYGYQIAIHLVVDPSNGDGPGGDPWVNFFGGDLESAKPLVVENTAGTPDDTTNGCTFTGYAFGCNQTANDAITIEPTFDGRLSFTNCNINGIVDRGIFCEEGATGWLGVMNTEIQQWATSAIHIEGTVSADSMKVTFIGNRYKGTVVPTYDLSGRVTGVSMGNRFASTFINGVSSASSLPFMYGPDLFSDGAVGSYGNRFRVGTAVIAAEGAWSANYQLIGINGNGFQLVGGNSSTGDGNHILTGAYFDGTNWKFSLTSVAASNYTQSGGEHIFRVSPGGTPGNNITWRTGLTIDGSSTADNTALLLWDVTAGTLKRVSRGATDSGGTGFRLLRIPN